MKTHLCAMCACAVTFLATASAWAQCELSAAPALTDTSGQYFGRQMAVDGDRLVVDGYTELHVYDRTDGGWAIDAVIPLNGQATRSPGSNLDLSGDRIIVTLVRLYPDGPTGARIFRKDPAGWVIEQEFELIGDSIAMDDDLAVMTTRR